MSYSSPTPPQALPADLVETFDEYSPDLLRHVAQYAEELAEYRERERRLAEQEKDEGERIEERPENLPSDVPARATITVKDINDNCYYYWQWREGDKIKSKYKGPVNSDNS